MNFQYDVRRIQNMIGLVDSAWRLRVVLEIEEREREK